MAEPAKKAAAAAAKAADERPAAKTDETPNPADTTPDAVPDAVPQAAPSDDAGMLSASERKRRIKAGICVVPDTDPTPHVGRAVNGVVCSAHAMRYRSDGTPRS